MSWRNFRNQKPKNLTLFFIEDLEQIDILQEITNLTSKKKDITKLYKKLLLVNNFLMLFNNLSVPDKASEKGDPEPEPEQPSWSPIKSTL